MPVPLPFQAILPRISRWQEGKKEEVDILLGQDGGAIMEERKERERERERERSVAIKGRSTSVMLS